MAERRVRDGDALIERQCQLIHQLERDGSSSEAARDLLIVLMAAQEANFQKLSRLRDGAADGAPATVVPFPITPDSRRKT
jgi:hypothetical protein